MIKHLLIISLFLFACSGNMIVEPDIELSNKTERWELLLQKGLIDKEEFDYLIRSGKRVREMRNLMKNLMMNDSNTGSIRLYGGFIIHDDFWYCCVGESVRFDGRNL